MSMPPTPPRKPISHLDLHIRDILQHRRHPENNDHERHRNNKIPLHGRIIGQDINIHAKQAGHRDQREEHKRNPGDAAHALGIILRGLRALHADDVVDLVGDGGLAAGEVVGYQVLDLFEVREETG